MAKYTVIYTVNYCVDIEADSFDEAHEIANSYSNQDIIEGQPIEYMEFYLDEIIEED